MILKVSPRAHKAAGLTPRAPPGKGRGLFMAALSRAVRLREVEGWADLRPAPQMALEWVGTRGRAAKVTPGGRDSNDAAQKRPEEGSRRLKTPSLNFMTLADGAVAWH
jgi:hypothetical protein